MTHNTCIKKKKTAKRHREKIGKENSIFGTNLRTIELSLLKMIKDIDKSSIQKYTPSSHATELSVEFTCY